MTKAREADSLAREGGLEVRLERGLPRRLWVGPGNAVFVCGTCFHPSRAISALRLLADGRSADAIAHGMPRRDLFEAGLPYRSGFWGIVPFWPRNQPGEATIRAVATLDDGTEAEAEVGTLELEPGAPGDPAPAPARASHEPLIAICMATYDPPIGLLRRQIDSIRAQTHRNWICVISDDHSREEPFAELEALVAGDERFVLRRSPERLGFYANFERALMMAPAEAAYVALVDQDDRWEHDKLEVLTASIDDAELVFSDARVVNEEGEVVSETYWSRRRTNHTNLASLLISNTITGAASLFRRELLARALPFPPTLGRQWHDHWIALVALSTGRVAYVDRPLYDYVQHRDAVVGHSAANRANRGRRPREGLRMGRGEWRAMLGGWCWEYFYGVCRGLMLARVLELRCGTTLRGRKRRSLRWFLAIDRSPLGIAWLTSRRLRRLAGRDETLGGEWLLVRGLAWRRTLALLTWRRRVPPAKLLKDASLPASDGEWPPTP